MADRAAAWNDNAPGTWYVDRGCIDCGVCRWVAPDTFGDAEDHAFVQRQPDDPDRAARAAVACPVGAIGGEASAIRVATRAFPEPVLPDVSFCGWAQRDTYGALSWLILRKDGNVLVDVPRPVPALMDAVAALGGVRWIFLTHRDDVAGHDRWAARFGAARILHARDLSADTRAIERPIDGDAPVAIAPDLLAIPVPGHTPGSAALLYRDDVLFTGDHLWGQGPLGWHAEGPAGAPRLGAGRSVCWWSWDAQIRSMERLREHRFAHVLPGHGRPWHGGHDARIPALDALIGWMRTA